MRLYHGSTVEVREPDISRGRTDIDFGQGFYMTEDVEIARKWAARKGKPAIISEYELDLHGLKVTRLGLTEEWLDFISCNRGVRNDIEYSTEDIDVIIGPIANDKMFDVLNNYFFSKTLDLATTLRYLDIVGYGEQVMIKSENALQKLSFLGSEELLEQDRLSYFKESVKERKEASKKIENLIRAERGIVLTDEIQKRSLRYEYDDD